MAFDKFINEELDLSPLAYVTPEERKAMAALEEAFNIVREVPASDLVADLPTELIWLFGTIKRAPTKGMAILWALTVLRMYYEQRS